MPSGDPMPPQLILSNRDELALMDVSTGAMLYELIQPDASVYWHPQGEFVLVAGQEVPIWQVSADGTQWTYIRTIPTISDYPSVAWHPTESSLAIGDGTVLRVADVLTDATLAMTVIPVGYPHEVTSLTWNPAGNQIAFSLWLDTFIYIWDID